MTKQDSKRSNESQPKPVLCLSLYLSLVVGFFFFLAAIWVDLILVSNCSGWFAIEVLLRQWILVTGGCAFDVDDNGGGDNILF